MLWSVFILCLVFVAEALISVRDSAELFDVAEQLVFNIFGGMVGSVLHGYFGRQKGGGYDENKI
jgi:hypothetical protein